MAAALLLLGGGWAGYQTVSAWGNDPVRPGSDLGARPELEDFSFGAKLSGEDQDAEVWMRGPLDEFGGQEIEYWIIMRDGSSCQGVLRLPEYEVWDVLDTWAECTEPGGAEPGSAEEPTATVLFALVPKATTSGEFDLLSGEQLPMTLLDTPGHWPVATAAVLLEHTESRRPHEIRLEPPTPHDALFMLPPLEPESPDAAAAIGSLPSRLTPLATARVGEELLAVYLDDYACGLRAIAESGPEILDISTRPPDVSSAGRSAELPGGPYGFASKSSGSGASAEIHCGVKDLVVEYVPEDPAAELSQTTGPVTPVAEEGARGGLVFAVGAEERRLAIGEHYAEQQEQ
jgi:hypothetical protein